MEGLKGYFLLPTKGILVKAISSLRDKAKGNRHGLVSLYKDMEACAGYTDLQVMWEMIHSSGQSNNAHNKIRTRPSQWMFCFRPT
ncbi:U-box domain-containing protein [Actinidia chinensis var. chinensis]|uniref:U-box domain-containing protein n=1 Tax=Actinidia chinensis var. chinensis TaxID=1590841 RepID=A0A2R6R8F9_ACTCC|nr:U-box domain-containing protein [Actinidia chinensis var. chinensis]